MDNTTTVPTAKNSLCQFWDDSNQKRAVPRYWSKRDWSLTVDVLLRVVMVRTTRGMAEKGHNEQHG